MRRCLVSILGGVSSVAASFHSDIKLFLEVFSNPGKSSVFRVEDVLVLTLLTLLY